jgi:ArsR family transcriptional regulator
MSEMDDLCGAPILAAPISEREAAEVAVILKALADPIRLRLVSVVAAGGEACACDLPALVGRAQPTVSHHLSQLVKAGILEREQRGKWAWFAVNEARIAHVRDLLGSDDSPQGHRDT